MHIKHKKSILKGYSNNDNMQILITIKRVFPLILVKYNAFISKIDHHFKMD